MPEKKNKREKEPRSALKEKVENAKSFGEKTIGLIKEKGAGVINRGKELWERIFKGHTSEEEREDMATLLKVAAEQTEVATAEAARKAKEASETTEQPTERFQKGQQILINGEKGEFLEYVTQGHVEKASVRKADGVEGPVFLDQIKPVEQPAEPEAEPDGEAEPITQGSIEITGVDENNMTQLTSALYRLSGVGWKETYKIVEGIAEGNPYTLELNAGQEMEKTIDYLERNGATAEMVEPIEQPTGEEEKQPEEKDGFLKNKELQKQIAKTTVGSVASIVGVKSFYDVPAYFKQRFMVRGMFGKGKGVEGSIDELFEASKKKKSLQSKEENFGKNKEVQQSIKDLNKRLKQTKEGSQKGSEQRKKIATLLMEHRRIAREEKEYTEQDKTERHDKVKEILDDYTTTKVTGMQAIRESLNTFFVASGAYGLRGVSYALTDGAGRFSKLRKEARIKAKKETGEIMTVVELEDDPTAEIVEKAKIAPEKVRIIKDVIVGAITETYKNATGKSEAKTKTGKGVAAVKAWGQIARYAGIAAMGIRPEFASNSIENALDGLSGKVKLGGAARNFQENLHRTTIGRITSVKRVGNLFRGKTEITAPVIGAKASKGTGIEVGAKETGGSQRPKLPTEEDLNLIKPTEGPPEPPTTRPVPAFEHEPGKAEMPSVDYSYKGGDNVWEESENQLKAVLGDKFDNLSVEDKNILIDDVKDSVVEKIGQPESTDYYNKMTEDDLKAIDWEEHVRGTIKSRPQGLVTPDQHQDIPKPTAPEPEMPTSLDTETEAAELPKDIGQVPQEIEATGAPRQGRAIEDGLPQPEPEAMPEVVEESIQEGATEILTSDEEFAPNSLNIESTGDGKYDVIWTDDAGKTIQRKLEIPNDTKITTMKDPKGNSFMKITNENTKKSVTLKIAEVKEKSRLRSVFGGEDIVTEGKNGKRIGLKRLTELLGRKTSRGTSIESFDLSPSTHKAATGAWADIKGTSESPVPLETSKPTELPAEPTEAPVTPQKAKQSIKILDGERSKGKISTEQPIEIMRSGPTHEEQGVDNYSNMKEINTEDAPKTPELKTSSETSNRSEELVRMAIDTAKKKSIPKLEADLKGINEQLLQDPESEGLLFRKVAILEALAEKKTGK